MKNIISAAIIATVALGATAASADVTKLGVVYQNGVAVGTMYDAKIASGKTDTQARAEVKAHYIALEEARKTNDNTKDSVEKAVEDAIKLINANPSIDAEEKAKRIAKVNVAEPNYEDAYKAQADNRVDNRD